MALLLNIASGTDLRPAPWVNLDVVPRWPGTDRGCDVLFDARKERLPFGDATVDGLYAGYLLLHISERHHARNLAEMRRVLKPGARAEFREVDMAIVMPRWLADPHDRNLSQLIWGECGSAHGEALEEFDRHVWGFTEEKLARVLLSAGFTNVQRLPPHPGVFYDLNIECAAP